MTWRATTARPYAWNPLALCYDSRGKERNEEILGRDRTRVIVMREAKDASACIRKHQTLRILPCPPGQTSNATRHRAPDGGH
jgi:hypothetical protein